MAENLTKLLESMVSDLNISYDEILKFQDPLNYSQATGVWLDYIASIVGEEPREWDVNTNTPSVSDEEYRKLIGVKISLNNGSGGTEDVITAVRRYALMGSGDWDSVKDAQFTISEQQATIYIDVVNGNHEEAYRVKQYVSAGVGLFLATTTSTPFAFSSLDPNYVPGTGPMGFSNLTTPTDGGNLKFFLTIKD
jgi:hypothetical protein